jgi:general secretion pathway protein A
LVRDLEPKVRTVIVRNPHIDLDGLLRLLLHQLEIDSGSGDSTAMFDRLNSYLIEQRRNGRVVSLLIDEAQDLEENTLDELRLLSNMESEDEALLSIVLMGQPELDIKLDHPSARRLKQRVALTRHIYPLIRKEVGPYIEHRLKVANCQGTGLFDPDAMERIANYSRGIPRMVNSICDNALIKAYTANESIVSPKIIDQVARELRIADSLPALKQTSPPELGGFSNTPAAFASGSKTAVKELTPTSDQKRMVELVNPTRPQAAPGQPQSSGSANLKQLATTTDFRRSAGATSGATSGGKELSSNESAPHASTGRLPVFHPWLRLQRVFRPFRLRGFAVAASGGLFMLAIGGIVHSWPLAGIYSVASFVKRPMGPDDPLLQPERGRSTGSEQSRWPSSNSSATELVALGSEKALITIAKTDERNKVTGRSNGSETQAKYPERSNASQAGLPQSANLRREEPAAPSRDNQGQLRDLPGTFKVVAASLVRSEPNAKAAIVTTLEPGSRVRVLARSRDFYQVRSLEHKSVQGYVHREDAFFERKNSG